MALNINPPSLLDTDYSIQYATWYLFHTTQYVELDEALYNMGQEL